MVLEAALSFGVADSGQTYDVVELTKTEGTSTGAFDPQELTRRFPHPISYARACVLASEAYLGLAGVSRDEAIDYACRLLLSPKDPGLVRGALRELGFATGIVELYPLEILDHMILAYPGHLPKHGYGRVFERESGALSMGKEEVQLSLVPGLKVRGFALFGGPKPGYRFEPSGPDTYRLHFESNGTFHVGVSGVTRAGYTLIDRFDVRVESRPHAWVEPPAPHRDEGLIASWPIPEAEEVSLFEEIADRAPVRRKGKMKAGELQGTIRSGESHRAGPPVFVVPELPLALPELPKSVEITASAPWQTSVPESKKLSYRPTQSLSEATKTPDAAEVPSVPAPAQKRVELPKKPLKKRKKAPPPQETAAIHFRSIQALPDEAVASKPEVERTRDPRAPVEGSRQAPRPRTDPPSGGPIVGRTSQSSRATDRPNPKADRVTARPAGTPKPVPQPTAKRTTESGQGAERPERRDPAVQSSARTEEPVGSAAKEARAKVPIAQVPVRAGGLFDDDATQAQPGALPTSPAAVPGMPRRTGQTPTSDERRPVKPDVPHTHSSKPPTTSGSPRPAAISVIPRGEGLMDDDTEMG